jgi:hypothetical protein
MPAERLRDALIPVRQFDVGGQDSDDVDDFVRHVGLALQPHGGLTQGSSAVRLAHMGPPLSIDGDGDADPIQTIATTELTADEILQIQVFIDELSSEYQAESARPRRQYIICPHAVDPDEQFPFRRFNCAGFAVEAYRDAGIELVQLNEASLPTVSLATLKHAYPDHASRLDNAPLREAYGLKGDGPWPVLLAGYVINAMARDVAAIRDVPYSPSPGDEFFPPQPPPDHPSDEEATESTGE